MLSATRINRMRKVQRSSLSVVFFCCMFSAHFLQLTQFTIGVCTISIVLVANGMVAICTSAFYSPSGTLTESTISYVCELTAAWLIVLTVRARRGEYNSHVHTHSLSARFNPSFSSARSSKYDTGVSERQGFEPFFKAFLAFRSNWLRPRC